MKTCPYCKFEIPEDALVCGHCRKNQPRSSVTKTPEQIQSGKTAKRGCLIFAGAALAPFLIFSVVAIVDSISDSIKKGKISAEVDQEKEIEQQSSTETAKAILPGINRYADLLEGKIQVSAADHKKEAAKLRGLADVANKQSATVESLGWGGLGTGKTWRHVSAVLTTDAEVMEAISSKMKPSERSASAQLHRKLAAVLQQHANEGFVNFTSFETDLYGVGGDFTPLARPEQDKYQRYVSEHPEACADRTAAQCAELPALMKQACDGLGGCTDLGVN